MPSEKLLKIPRSSLQISEMPLESDDSNENITRKKHHNTPNNSEIRPKQTHKPVKAESLLDIKETALKNDLTASEKEALTSPEKNNRKKKKKAKYLSELIPTGFTQDLIKDIKDIVGSVIITNNNRYICCMEIFPIAFHQKTTHEKADVLNNYKKIFEITSKKGHLKSITELTDIDTLISRIKDACPASRGKHMLDIRNSYIEDIYRLQATQTINYRYFFFFEYEGNAQGIRSDKFEEIYQQLMMIRNSIEDTLAVYGNYIAKPENETLYTADIIYHLLNRNTYMKEPLINRIARINSDCEKCGKKPKIIDYLAPKGAIFENKDFMLMNGLYYTFFALQGSTIYDEMPPDWLTYIRPSVNLDIDFFFDQVDYRLTKRHLENKTMWDDSSYRSTNNKKRAIKLAGRIKTSSYIVDRMNSGDNLYDCCTVFTLYNTNAINLLSEKDAIKLKFKSIHMQIEEGHMNMEEFFLMTLPLLKFRNSIFNRNKRNMTTLALKNTYFFTTYNLYDDSEHAIVIGPNNENNTLCSIDKFNTTKHLNPHVTIIGKSGAGKSHIEKGFGRRDNIMGLKTFYIIPAKGFEYIPHVKAMNGLYIKFAPGSKDIYNIMELFPEVALNEEEEYKGISVVARKVTSLCTWFRILSASETKEQYKLSNKDLNKINGLLTELYEDFGFTSDNDSIWTDETHSEKKLMPILSDWYQRMKMDGELEVYADLLIPFIKGSFRNFNAQSTIDITKECIVFDIDKDDIGEDLLASFLYLAFDLCSGLIRMDERLATLFFDEVWRLLIDKIIGELLAEDIRLLRSYGGSVVCASQQIKEFVGSDSGDTIINQSATIILLQMKYAEVELVSEHIPLDESDKIYLQHAQKGDMLIISRNSKTRCHFSTSLLENYTYCTEKKEKVKLRKMLEEQGVVVNY